MGGVHKQGHPGWAKLSLLLWPQHRPGWRVHASHSRPPCPSCTQDEHMYFWFPLLAGLSELTFDPRPEIRCEGEGQLFIVLYSWPPLAPPLH